MTGINLGGHLQCSSITLVHLQSHKDNTHDSNSQEFACEQCHKKYKRKETLIRHINDKHASTNN